MDTSHEASRKSNENHNESTLRVRSALRCYPTGASKLVYLYDVTKHLLKTPFGSLTYFGFCRLGILFYCNQVTPCTLDDFTDQYFLAALKIWSTDPDNRNVDYYSVVLCIPVDKLSLVLTLRR